MLSDCVAKKEDNPDVFSKWECDFIDSVSGANETFHLTQKQAAVLKRIWIQKSFNRV